MNFNAEDFLFTGVLVLVAIALWMVKHFANPPMVLHEWAKEQGFRIVRASLRELHLGPFASGGLRTGQEVYQIVILRPDGVKQSAWVRCNHASGAQRVEVVWGVTSSKPAAAMRVRLPG